MELDTDTEPFAEGTLVTVWVRNERATDRRVRLTNRLDGPVLPPRRNKQPEPGWDREGVTIVVPAGEQVALGYACPAEPASPPVSVAWVEAAEEPVRDPVADAMRRLGDHRPPRDALADGERAANHDALPNQPEPGGASSVEPARSSPLPSEAAALLGPARRRIETVEALGAVGVPAAADLLEVSGGLAGVEATRATLDDDAVALRALAAEAKSLAARAEAATPPTETLRRLS